MSDRMDLIDLEAMIREVSYKYSIADGTVLCVIKLENGYTVAGTAEYKEPANRSRATYNSYDEAYQRLWYMIDYVEYNKEKQNA